MADQHGTARPGWRLTNAAWRFIARADTAHEDTALRWSWRVVASNGVIWVGDEGFATLPLCQADAMKHGYVQQQP